MATKVPNNSPNLLPTRPICPEVQFVDKAPADASEILSTINSKQTEDNKLEGIILYICKNRPNCKGMGLWAVCWVKKPKRPKHLKVRKYKELAVAKVCADCEFAEWELVDKAESEGKGKDEAEDWVGV
ncbi:uncharacterized protein Z520_11491 [Fonsecaea multimorphosa CBS 102226]|uniref:Uncharacterized protein n=1 Tax=Fonsecaea multimorphosa CBS 102226 TaxID=1442371 RepID=A0A0D2K904_9EURO|nr:uncharacterized protein Z520_11491 [Fonsecaea multimorphosa CBS 102226]KIX92828.1 hypothetical protein Z520_11491 [Fonsecaea multimorphosa CBS 102226]OAL18076.1 hypothetical protein AYO22_10998 [Fonsecaea multimorphosa]